MKKIVFILIISIVSCSTDDTNSIMEEVTKAESTFQYIYEGEHIEIDFIETKDSVIIVENDAARRVEDIFTKNPELIEYSVEYNKSILFKSDQDFSEFLENSGKINHKKNVASKNAYWTNQALQLYAEKDFNKSSQIPWVDEGVMFFTYRTNNYPANSHEMITLRLKYLYINDYWKVDFKNKVQFPPYKIPVKPDDNIASVLVEGLIVRFYEHPNYRGKSFVLDGTTSVGQVGIKKLQDKKISFFHRWDNKISSIRVY